MKLRLITFKMFLKKIYVHKHLKLPTPKINIWDKEQK